MRIRIPALLAPVVVFLAAAPLMAATSLLPLWRTGTVSDGVGTANIVTADVNGDGVADALSCSNGAAYAISRAGSSFATSWISAPVGCTGIAAGDLDGDGVAEIVVGTNKNSTIHVFTTTSLVPKATFATPTPTVAVADVGVADVDGNGTLEIVVVTSGATYVYNGTTLERTIDFIDKGGKKVGFGDVDGDGQPEIVVNGSTGHVLSAISKTEKFGYVGGFGISMAVGDVDGGAAEIIFVYNSSINVFDAQHFLTKWKTNTSSSPWYYFDSVGIGDVNGDGAPEVLGGENQWGDIVGFNGANGTVLWSVANPEHGVSDVAAGDIDGDGATEVVWGAGLTSSGTDAMFIASKTAIKWSTPDLDGPYHVATGDLDGDGRREMAIATTSSESGYEGGIVQIFDANGLPTSSFKLTSSISRIGIGQFDSDPATDIVLLISSYNSQIALYSKSGTLKWSSNGGTFLSRPILARDIDADGIDEIFAITSDKHIDVLHGASNIIQWQSPLLDYTVADQTLGDLDGDGVPELVATTGTTVYVFETTGWTLRTSFPVSYATHVAVADHQIYIASGSYQSSPLTIRAYSGTDYQLSWQCSPGNGLATAMKAATVTGAGRLLLTDSGGNLLVIPRVAGGCASADTIAVAPSSTMNELLVAPDMTESTLAIAGSTMVEVDAIGSSTALRGDANLDGVVDDADIDRIFGYYFDNGAGLPTSADCNADMNLNVSDMFFLIDYRHGGGAPPPP